MRMSEFKEPSFQQLMNKVRRAKKEKINTSLQNPVSADNNHSE